MRHVNDMSSRIFECTDDIFGDDENVGVYAKALKQVICMYVYIYDLYVHTNIRTYVL